MELCLRILSPHPGHDTAWSPLESHRLILQAGQCECEVVTSIPIRLLIAERNSCARRVHHLCAHGIDLIHQWSIPEAASDLSFWSLSISVYVFQTCMVLTICGRFNLTTFSGLITFHSLLFSSHGLNSRCGFLVLLYSVSLTFFHSFSGSVCIPMDLLMWEIHLSIPTSLADHQGMKFWIFSSLTAREIKWCVPKLSSPLRMPHPSGFNWHFNDIPLYLCKWMADDGFSCFP